MAEPTPHEYAVRIAVLETKLQSADEARVLQAREYERRLQDLNHAHQQAVDRNATFVSRELYDSGVRELHLAIANVRKDSDSDAEKFDQRMSAQQKVFSDRLDGLSAKVYTGVGIAVAVQVMLFVIVEVWKR